jgi:hypothetical protein
LTLPQLPGKSNPKVRGTSSNFYAQWRLESGAAGILRDAGDIPPERLLQSVWQHQRLLRHQLRTLDGKSVRILHPGFLSREGGPDFRDAVVQFGGDTPLTGDIEVDLHAGGWHAHNHDKNPAFANVILHVIWNGDNFSGRTPPRLVIRDRLDSPIADLARWLNSDGAETLPKNMRGRCSAPLRELAPEKLDDLLRQAAQIRFQSKTAQISTRARHVGWEQTLWEGIFRALGYKRNSWPMQCLAEQRERWFDSAQTPIVLQSRLLGIGNLLPAELTRAQAGADTYLRRAWDQWWREREEFADCILPRALWQFHGQRPANHPQRRIALAAHWLCDENFVSKIETWCTADLADNQLADSLLKILHEQRDEFWSWHWTLRSARLAKPQPLLGAARVTDLAVNLILPWLWSRAHEGGSEKIQRVIEHRFNAWPAAEDNSVLRFARQRLLSTSSPRVLRTAAHQQGLLQIVRDFCDHSNSICEQCRFPELVRTL